jgi:predicted DNA binding CopG/RHH family protein
MTRKIKYTKGEIGKVEIINDFLPSPKELVLKKESVKVTLVLSKESVDFFKSQALNHHVPYQRMIKNLLDKYADSHKKLKKA